AVTGVALVIAAAAFAAGILWAETGVLVLGAVFLAEELYETGVLAVIVRFGEGAAAHRPPGAFPVTSPASQPPPRARSSWTTATSWESSVRLSAIYTASRDR